MGDNNNEQYEPGNFKLPEWMEPYRDFIVNTGGNEIEDLINDLDTNSGLGRTNWVRFSIAMAVKSQVSLLVAMRRNGLLAGVPASGGGR